ncbi:hypothetical protein HPB50_004780 [Hyalomma asiaticum]|uniref:Uncharacterized protein n=1 Tax=Hyalomma asiaticum TaxID=266040 RepID=A0ACB7SML5_HYAAI|nr:hypothetical protein HPB50_004780 [Hyalomma asiaticum]
MDGKLKWISCGRRTIATWTILDPAGSPVGWASRLPWELQPRPAIGDPPAAAPEPFRGNLLTERYPTEPLATYTPEEARLLCPTCGVPEIHRRQHQNGALSPNSPRRRFKSLPVQPPGGRLAYYPRGCSGSSPYAVSAAAP